MLRRSAALILVVLVSVSWTAPAAAGEPGITITIDRFGSVDAIGQAHISGTITCDGGGALGADVYVRQRVSGLYHDGDGVKGFTDGFGFAEMPCDGTPQPWVGSAVSRSVDDEGNFIYKAGLAYAAVFTFGGEAFAEATVILRPSD
jgi:hypothetical protein